MLAYSDLLSHFADSMQGLFQPYGSKACALAVSGGSDSMAMLLLASKWAKHHQVCLYVLTVDHGLRDCSAEEASIVKQCCKNLGLSHHTLIWQEKKPSANIQAKAREARYRLMADWCREHNIACLLTAHTIQDQAETVLMHVMRGSGVYGLSAIAAHSSHFGINILRPLLEVSREALQTYLKEQEQQWVEDSSNADPKYMRSRLRQFLALSDEPERLIQRLSDTAAHMQRARDAIDAMVGHVKEEQVVLSEQAMASIPLAAFQTLPLEVGYRVLASLLMDISGNIYVPRFEKLQQLYQQVVSCEPAGGTWTLSGCCIIVEGQGQLHILREAAPVEPNRPIVSGQVIAWDGRFNCRLSGSFKVSDTLYIGAVSLHQWDQLDQCVKQSINVDIPFFRKILPTLPALKSFDNVHGVEIIHAIPHINYWVNPLFEGKLSCEYVKKTVTLDPSDEINT